MTTTIAFATSTMVRAYICRVSVNNYKCNNSKITTPILCSTTLLAVSRTANILHLPQVFSFTHEKYSVAELSGGNGDTPASTSISRQQTAASASCLARIPLPLLTPFCSYSKEKQQQKINKSNKTNKNQRVQQQQQYKMLSSCVQLLSTFLRSHGLCLMNEPL